MMSVPGVALRERLSTDRAWLAGSTQQRLARRWLGPLVPARYSVFGLAVAAFFVCLSLTPSLLPRGPAFQGWLSGIVAAAGYGLGVLVGRIRTAVTSRRPGPRGQGIGRHLVAAVDALARRRGCVLLGANAPAGGAPAALLTAAGFQLHPPARWERPLDPEVGMA